MANQTDSAVLSLSRLLGRIKLLRAEWVRVRLAPGESFSVSAGDHFAAYFVTRGALQLVVDDEPPLMFHSGGTAILPRGTRHSVRREDAIPPSKRLDCFADSLDLDIPRIVDVGSVSEENAAVVLSAQLHFEWPSELPRPQSLPSLLLGTRTYNSDRSAAESAARALDITARRPGAVICLSRFAELLLVRELRDALLAHPELFLSRDELTAAMVRAIDAVRMKPAHPWTVEKLAHHVAMSRSSFAVAFKTFYRRGPMEVVTEHRMEIAAKMLSESSMRIKTIAAKVGYGSETAFLRRFTAHFGVPPTSYRRELAGEGHTASDWLELLRSS